MSTKFTLGDVVVTNRAAEILAAANLAVDALLQRHQSGDWGDVSDDQRQINDDGVSRSYSLVSSYSTRGGHTVAVFTMADRSRTLVHLAEPAYSKARVKA